MREVRTFTVGGREFGGDRPLVCVPIVARTGRELARAAEEMPALDPDIVEWRADYLEEIPDTKAVLGLLDCLRKRLSRYPILFTCRSEREGGVQAIPEDRRVGLIREVIRTGQAEMVDFELSGGEDAVRELVSAARAVGVRVILSSHDFEGTPPEPELLERMRRMQDLGADAVKIAVMPRSMGDVLVLLSATLAMRERYAEVPLVTMSMSGLGLVSRVCGCLFGSAMTFAAGRDASAPGQIPAAELRRALELFRGCARKDAGPEVRS